MNNPTILPFDSEAISLANAGGKGTNLARLAAGGFPVPGGFIVTTAAYDSFVRANQLWPVIRDTLSVMDSDSPTALESASAAIRARFAEGTIPPSIALDVRMQLQALGAPAVAVRSSATAEDLPELSFAGQQDTFLNVVGDAAVLEAIIGCWSSLWTARAIGYRARSAIAHEGVSLAVVVQEMVQSEASGVLFTANPLTGKRAETVIEATLGLGEALVSGQVEPDQYVVDSETNRVLSRRLGSKSVAIYGQASGGTITRSGDAAARAALPDPAILQLAAIGRQVAAHFDAPQDIEWAWANERLYLVQSRPVTSLFPIPEGLGAEPPHLLFSFASVQGLLDPITPLGRETIMGFFAGGGRAFGSDTTLETQRVLLHAGERLWVDLTGLTRYRPSRAILRRVFPNIEPAGTEPLEMMLSRQPEPQALPPRGARRRVARTVLPMLGRFAGSLLRPDANREKLHREVESLVQGFAARSQRARDFADQLALYEAVMDASFGFAVPRLLPRIMAGIIPLFWLQTVAKRMGLDPHEVLELTRALPYNVTTEMDLELWQTAQAIRADNESRAFFTGNEAGAIGRAYLDGTLPLAARDALGRFMARYGMRGMAEIDLGRPRWREDPSLLVQTLKSYLEIEQGRHSPTEIFARGEKAASATVEKLERAARQKRLGALRARVIRAAARRIRALAGLRESPKFMVIRLLGFVRSGLLESAGTLVEEGVLERPDDIFFLRVSELRALAGGRREGWQTLIADRRERYDREMHRARVPRVMLSDGQAFYGGGAASGEASDGALVGTPVSPGVVEGTVRVVLDPHNVRLAPGEILVCPATDPGWTPLFLAAGGLVTEVGGLMTHGSVVAREYGIPAVVGVDQATTRLQTGQRVRLDGSTGRIEFIDWQRHEGTEGLDTGIPGPT